MFQWISKIKTLFPYISKLKGIDWDGLIKALTKGSWKTRLIAVCSLLLFVISIILSIIGVEVPDSIWLAGVTLCLSATSWLVREEKVTSEQAGVVPDKKEPEEEKANPVVHLDPVDPPPDYVPVVEGAGQKEPDLAVPVEKKPRRMNAAEKNKKVNDELAKRKGI
jgi:hypothetical protein